MTIFHKKLFKQLGISLGIIVVLSGFIVYIFSDLRAVGKLIETNRLALATRTQNISSLAALRERSKEAETKMNQLRTILPDRESLFIFSAEVNRLAREQNLSPIFSFRDETISELPNVPSKASFIINVSGERLPILTFIRILEATPYLTRIQSIEWTASDGAPGGVYRAILSGEIFFNQ